MQHPEYNEYYFGNLFENEWRLQYFFHFLQISPSYRAAHLHKTQKLAAPNQSDFSRVLRTYRDFGDVWSVDFKHWWLSNAKAHFESDMQPKPETLFNVNTITARGPDDIDRGANNMLRELDSKIHEYIANAHVKNGFPNLAVIAVPLDGSKREIKRYVRELLEAEWKKIKPAKATSKFAFVQNKTRRLTLEKCLYAVHQHAINRANGDHSLLTLGIQISTKFKSSTRHDSKEPPSNESIRSQTSNLLAKALNIAEWASVGEFPKTGAHDRTRTVRTDNLESFLKDKKELREKERLRILENKDLNIQQFYEQLRAQENTPTDLHLEDEPKTYDISFDYSFIAEQISEGRIADTPK